jgi:hypothetical protein
MKIRTVLLVGVVLLMGRTAFAQEYTKWEIPVDYSYARGNGANIAPFSLNGGGGGIVYNFSRFFGIKGDLQGYGSTTRTFTSVPVQINPLIANPVTQQVSVNGNLFTYMAGPQLRLPTHTFKPFAEFLFGGAHTNTYANLVQATGFTASAAPNNNAFAMAIGGGFDIRVSKVISIRPFQMDYLLTRFGTSFLTGGNHNQNNFRYNAGLVFTFGE